MKIHIITIFPESFSSYFWSSIIKKAIDSNLVEFKYYKLNDFSSDNFKRVDSKAYWMHWQVISPEPLSKAIEYVFWVIWKNVKVIYMSPGWDLLTQEKVENYFEELWEEFIITFIYF